MALIPPFYLDCVVAIGDSNKNWIGTGFLFGYKDTNSENYKTFLVTNKHILKDKKDVILRFNPKDSTSSKDYKLSLIDDTGKLLYKQHSNPNVDVAAINIIVNQLDDDGINYSIFYNDKYSYTINELKNLETTEGDPIFALGFPMGKVGNDRRYTLLRSGAIARIRDLLEGKSTDFIVDAFVFPGNSGGPIILAPHAIQIKNTKSNPKATLIGIVKSYLPYRDIAVSPQTGKARVIFEENTGLTLVEPVDHIIETIMLP